MKQRIYLLLLITFLTGAAAFFLVRSSHQPYEEKHGFNRLFNTDNKLKLLKSVPVAHALYVAGISNDQLYFHSDRPDILIYADTALDKIQAIPLPIDTSIGQYMSNGFSTHVRYPVVYVYAYNTAAILAYNLATKQLHVISTPSNFSNAVPISDTVFILKYFTGDSTYQSFARLNIQTQHYSTDSLFKADLSSSGTLLYDEQAASCSYIHHYNNNITVFDTALQLKRSGHTIDTFTQSQVQYMSSNQPDNKTVLYKPKGTRMLINYLCQIQDGKLYVNSLLKADNETERTNNQETTIDIYDANTDKYLESLHIPVFHGQFLKSFRIFNRKLLVTYSDHIALYALPSR